MQNLLAMLSEATRRGLLVGRAVVKVGRATVEIVVRVFIRR